MRSFLLWLAAIGLFQPFWITAIFVFWTFGLGFFEIVFIWNEFLNEFFINIRENYHPANLFNVFPYLIHSVILWWFLSFFYLIFFHKKTGMIESLNDINGDM